mgnify:CR=1 FL=1|tara:strand:- start:454 stop:1875 length:1422 start_codon:yes stop_codon:yes gene_type:complete
MAVQNQQHEDTYFFSAEAALRHASISRTQNQGYWMQCCYYDGEKLPTNLPNLFHQPFDGLTTSLADGSHRIPTAVSFENTNFASSKITELVRSFRVAVAQAKNYRGEFNRLYAQALTNANPDFTEPLRFYLQAHKNTRVMRYAAQNIATAIQDLGYEVFFNLFNGTEDLQSNKDVYEFNPHVTININWLDQYISANVFNFVWIQDAMEWLISENTVIKLRERDKIFHLTEYIFHLLQNRGVQSEYQPFCVNTRIFKKRDDIKRRKKIVMIGSSYKPEWDLITSPKKHTLCESFLHHYLNKGHISRSERVKLQAKHPDVAADIENIIKYVERDLLLKHILLMGLDIDIEVFGYGWDQDSDFHAFYKGELRYGEEVSKEYNRATYALVIGGYVLQQRTLEAAASGAIPLVLEPHEQSSIQEKKRYENSLVFFKTPHDLKRILEDHHKPDLEYVVSDNSFQRFAEKILAHVQEAIC